MSDECETPPETPGDLWGVRHLDGSIQGDNKAWWSVTTDREVIRRCVAGLGAEAVLIGVSPSWRDRAIEAESDMSRTVDDILAVIDGRDPDKWAWPLHGLRDRLVAAKAEVDRLKAELELMMDGLVESCRMDGAYLTPWYWTYKGVGGFEATRDQAIAAVRKAAGLDTGDAR